MAASKKFSHYSHLNMDFSFFKALIFERVTWLLWTVNLVFVWVNTSLLNELVAIIGIVAVLLNKIPAIVMRLVECWQVVFFPSKRRKILQSWRREMSKKSENG
jgi:hypothetical protein